MRTKRNRLAIALVLAVGMTGSLLVSSPSIAAVPLSGRIHGGAFKPIFRGTLPPLSEIAARRPARLRGAGSDAAAELEIIRRHQEQLGEEGGGEPDVSAPIPSGKNLPVKHHGADLKASWEGSNHFDSRYSDGGNQFSGEPPDQGLCAGNGFVMETVNSVVQVYDEAGHRLLAGQPGAPGGGAVGVSLSQAFGYPSEFVMPDGPFGPFLFDINCYYDAHTRRWFHLADDLEQDPTTGDFTGRSRLDLAVSTSANPLGRWKLYSWAGQNDGTQGTPNHTCDLGPCFPDYPQLGADANGIYITVNEYSFNGTDYNGVQLYALSKSDLVDGAHAPTALLFENLKVPELYQKAFTLRGAQSRPDSFERSKGGTEYFISSTAGDGTETGNLTGGSDNVVVWALTNTSSLRGHAPDPVLTHTVVDTIPYALPPLALQKPGKTPLLHCINIGAACSGLDAPFKQEGPYPLDAGDTRMMSSFFSHGVLWGTLDTSLKGKGGSEFGPGNNFAPDPIGERAGVAYFAIRPKLAGGLRARVLQQGAFGVKNANVTFPSFAMGEGKTGVLGATLVGPTMYPSAVYVKLGLGMKPKVVRVAARGKGPDDGFTGTFFGDFRPRWGDYGFAVPGDGNSVWFAAEYIAQQCGFAEFFNDPGCGGTRSFFANWSTRVSMIKT